MQELIVAGGQTDYNGVNLLQTSLIYPLNGSAKRLSNHQTYNYLRKELNSCCLLTSKSLNVNVQLH